MGMCTKFWIGINDLLSNEREKFCCLQNWLFRESIKNFWTKLCFLGMSLVSEPNHSFFSNSRTKVNSTRSNTIFFCRVLTCTLILSTLIIKTYVFQTLFPFCSLLQRFSCFEKLVLGSLRNHWPFLRKLKKNTGRLKLDLILKMVSI